MAFGGGPIHEFSHAFGYLSDEYIEGRSSVSDRVNPSTKSTLNLSNLLHSQTGLSQVEWRHLSPWGIERRQAAGIDPGPVVGWLWAGGVKHLGVWHSEYKCLMNGRHDNFAFTQVATNDPTWPPGGDYQDETNLGARLRMNSQFCLWCQELTLIRILEKTNQLHETGDPADLAEAGRVWYERWVSTLRSNYFDMFSVRAEIINRESQYAMVAPGSSGEPLWQSDLYIPMTADEPLTPRTALPLSDGELFLLTGVF